jgi:hypothetical protein
MISRLVRNNSAVLLAVCPLWVIHLISIPNELRRNLLGALMQISDRNPRDFLKFSFRDPLVDKLSRVGALGDDI